MKTTVLRSVGILLIPAFMACNNTSNDNANADSTATDMNTSEASYVNLSTGEPVTIVRDTEKGHYVYSDTKQPIEKDLFFVDVNTRDTLYGTSGVVVNNAVIKSPEGSWTLNEELVIRDGDNIKIKTADGKLKMDGDEMKYKEGDTKVKVDGDESKTKTIDSKTKTDGDESKTKTPDTKVKVDD
ncbi:hypothetical protein WG906_16505 [Pedobacter sp. P351]|uniref:hypothetical protein n=1 Tax=Pedobacter superstes TaxID=3133441 RepID=UPI0030B79067